MVEESTVIRNLHPKLAMSIEAKNAYSSASSISNMTTTFYLILSSLKADQASYILKSHWTTIV